MKFPGKLKKGGTIGLICPSSAIKTEQIAVCAAVLTGMGYRVKAAGNLDAAPDGCMAGSGRVRGYWLNRMFADPEVDAVFCVRGGDGSAHMMEYVDYETIRKNPKIFVGYSDVTNLLLGITQNCGIVVFHGPMVYSNMTEHFDKETKASFFEAINAKDDYSFRNPAGKEIVVLQSGRAAGELTGGNLSLLSASIGTPYEADTRGKILFIEEVGEPMRKIDKWMTHLKNAGKLNCCAGILLGQFAECFGTPASGCDVCKYLMDSDIFEGLDIPILGKIESGHGHPMMTLPMGAACTVDTEKKEIRFLVERHEKEAGCIDGGSPGRSVSRG